MTPAQRIKQMKMLAKETWLAPEVFECPDCGMEFRYENNLNEHCKRCIDFKYGK